MFNTSKKKLVRVFGTLKTYKKEKNLQGAKIMYAENDTEIIYHHLEIADSWLYLTGRTTSLNKEVILVNIAYRR
jgi:hypothetical protein